MIIESLNPNNRLRWVVVSAVGLCQVLAWGSSVYLPAVLSGPIIADTGWPRAWVVGGLSAGFLVSGLASPLVGRKIERHGGRPVLAASALLMAAGLLGLGLAGTLAGYIAAWGLIGLGMGAGLYDPVFATLGRLYGEGARPLITGVTLWGGFASTVYWPLGAYLAAHMGWRGACFAFAAIQAGIAFPLYALSLPREAPRLPPPRLLVPSPARGTPGRALRTGERAIFLLLATGFTLAAMITTVIAVHLLALLQAQGLGVATAVALGALVGPAQVGARVLEILSGKRTHPIWSLIASAVLAAVGLGVLVVAPGAAALGIVLYGLGSGLRSIARGTVPLALFGRAGYATLMGRLAMPALVAQAMSPAIGAWLLDHAGPGTTLAVLCGAAAVNIALVLALLPTALRGRSPG